MSNKNVPVNADEPRAEVEQTRRGLGDTVETLAHKENVRGRVEGEAHEGANTVKQTAARAKKPAAGKPADAAGSAVSKAGQTTDEAGAAAGIAAEKAGVKAEQDGAAREKATVVAAQLSEKATQAGQKAGAVADQLSEKATVVAGQVGEKAGVMATQVGVAAVQAVEALPEPVQQRVEQGIRQARQHPALVAVGAAAGVLLLWKLLRRGR
ncbi:hypothetical protein OG205_10925 [Lentzea sp. NBC_00516]|uniref:hypothetical protein n=1 Tax=Lentzea sp. NBC_00516 TaxID=2903582 RepID=UPI002E80C0CC|nr:hypothetical protein [Lentzea sp. NBC_00516]WUD27476.1 hypothetical protein OG205_10925 [Lentzea sp. NBC_00516]